MTTITRTIVLGPNHRDTQEVITGPRMVLEQHRFNPADYNLAIAQAELARGIANEANGSGTKGFYPAFDEVKDFPQTHLLEEQLQAGLLYGCDVGISFIRLCLAAKKAFFGNLHEDIQYVARHYGRRGTFREEGTGREITRYLINLHPSEPRWLQFIDESPEELSRRGIDHTTLRPDSVSSDDAACSNVSPHPEVSTRIVAIPPMGDGRLSVLKFWSSRVIHAGMTGTGGHFMVAAARYDDPSSSL